MLTTPILVGTAPVAAAAPGAGAAAPCAKANVPKSVLRPRPSARFLNCVMLMSYMLLGFSCGVRLLEDAESLRLIRCCCTSCRRPGGSRARWTCSIASGRFRCRGRSRRFHVVSVNQVLGDILSWICVEHWSLRVGDVQHHCITILFGVFFHHIQHFLAQPVQDFLFCCLHFILEVFSASLQALLLLRGGPDPAVALFIAQLVALGLELLLQVFQFVILGLQGCLSGSELLLQGI